MSRRCRILALRACAAVACCALALGAAAQEAAFQQTQVGLERATRLPQEIVWLRDDVLAEIWRQNPALGQALRSCAAAVVGKQGCAVGAKPPSRHAFGRASYADAGLRPVGGGVFLVAPRAEGDALVRAPSGEILLAAGAAVQLIDAAFPEIRIELRAPADTALPLGNLVAAEPGRVFGLLAKQPAAVSASTVSSAGDGRVAFKAAGEVLLAALSRPQTPRAPEPAGAAPAAAVAASAEHADIDQGSRALARAAGEGLGAEVVLYAALQLATAPPGAVVLPAEHRDIDQEWRALAYSTGEGLAHEVAFHGAPPAEALALRVTSEPPVRPTATPAASTADAARLRAEVEAEIERDRARLAAASQQPCAAPASVRHGCAVVAPRRFAFAG